uniref:Spondin-like TSP1 domain-containing protein n=1 Tax=Cuerna arida TaxID=1464854 RepID=A0A1B6G6B7_9HEMI
MRILVLIIFILYKIPCLQTTVLMNCVLGKEKCPLDGGWTLWTLWGPCEGECGAVGRQIRTRTCTNPHPDSNGEDCVGESRQLKQCSVAGCRYEQYEKLLSQNSLRTQQLQLLRKLSGFQPSLLSKCLTSSCEFQDVLNALPTSADEFWNALLCVKKNSGCPVSGGWGEWSGWTRCSAVCGEGQRMRCRVCCDPPPSSVDYGCPGDSCVYEQCSGTDCKIPPGHTAEGAWSEWSEWSKCNPPCNFGISRRSRICRKGRQNQKRKSVTEDGYMNSYDYDYYNDYYDNKYDLNGKPFDYDPEVAEESKRILRVLKRDDDKCDSQIEYYSTEDDEEEYSSSLSLHASTKGDQVLLEPTTHIKDVESTIQTENLELSSQIQNLELSSQVQDFELSTQTQDFELSSEVKNLEISTEEEAEIDFLPKTGYENVQDKFHTDYDETVSRTSHKLSTFALLTSEDTLSESENSESIFSDVMENTLLESDTTVDKVEVSDTTLKLSTKSSKSTKPTGIFTKPKDKSSTSGYKDNSKRTTLSSDTDNYTSRSKVSSDGMTILKDEEECKGAFDSDQAPGTMEPECTGELYKGSFLQEPAIGSLQSDAMPSSEMTEETPGQNSTPLEKPTITGKTGSLQSDTLPKSETTEETPDQYSTHLEKPTTTKKTGNHNSKSVPTSQIITKTTMETSTSEIVTPNPCDETDNTLCLLFTTKPFKTTIGSTEKLTTVFITETSEITTAFTTETSEIPSTTLNLTSALTTKIPTENTSSTLYTTSGTSLIPSNDTDSGNKTEPTGVSCDLKEALQLPSYESNFEIEDCTGPFEEVKPCNVSFCNEDGGWSSWSSWSACSADCGIGKQVTERSCTNPQPRKKGKTCQGDYTLRQPCYLQPCPGGSSQG